MINNNINWDKVLDNMDKESEEILVSEGVDPKSVKKPSEIIRKISKKALGKSDPKSCYE